MQLGEEAGLKAGLLKGLDVFASKGRPKVRLKTAVISAGRLVATSNDSMGTRLG